MTRSRGVDRLARRADVFARVKGFRGKRKNCWTIATRAAERSMQHEYIGRKLKKRDMRKLWITRIGIASRLHGVAYSRFMYGLAEADVALNRKVLSELSIHEPRTFSALAEVAKVHLPSNPAMRTSHMAAAQQPFKHAAMQAETQPQMSMNGVHWTVLSLFTSMLPSIFS